MMRKLVLLITLNLFTIAPACYEGTNLSGDSSQDVVGDQADTAGDVTPDRDVQDVPPDDDCSRYPVTLDHSSVTCPEEARVGDTVEISFQGFGYSCDCGGYSETSTSLQPPSASNHGRLDITALEVICDLSQCCEMCNCIDMFPFTVSVNFTQEGFYDNYMNDEYLCFTSVFGEDGCSDWESAYTDVIDYTAELYTDYGVPVSAFFTLSVSTGMCCGGGEVFVSEERIEDPDGMTRIILTPTIEICEGDCCYMCECIDAYETEHEITNLSVGSYEVCVDEECYTVSVMAPV